MSRRLTTPDTNAAAPHRSGCRRCARSMPRGRGRGRRWCAPPVWLQAVREIDAEAQALREALPDGTGLVITGDHGMLDVPDDRRIDADASRTLPDGGSAPWGGARARHPRRGGTARTGGVLLRGGEARCRHLGTAAGAADDVAAAWQAELGERAWVLTR